ncbi:hypothetical protein Ancab_011490 [Ancistrocladus abbreviatus]
MGINADDVKILIHKRLQCLMKSCHQCAKNHPLVLGVMILFIVLYTFFSSSFEILFYSFPFAICAAFYIGGTLDFGNMKKVKKDDLQEKLKDQKASVPGISQLDGREANSGQAHKFMGDISESAAECQEDDDEGEPQKEMNKAVQWTQDDQRNLMDLGSSEIERNRRLESLIAK